MAAKPSLNFRRLLVFLLPLLQRKLQTLPLIVYCFRLRNLGFEVIDPKDLSLPHLFLSLHILDKKTFLEDQCDKKIRFALDYRPKVQGHRQSTVLWPLSLQDPRPKFHDLDYHCERIRGLYGSSEIIPSLISYAVDQESPAGVNRKLLCFLHFLDVLRDVTSSSQ